MQPSPLHRTGFFDTSLRMTPLNREPPGASEGLAVVAPGRGEGMPRCSRVALLLALALAGSAAPIAAAPIGYDDRSAWEGAVAGGILFLETFDDITGDPSFSSAALDVGPFTIEQIGDPSQTGLSSTNLIDEAPFRFSGDEDVNGSTYVLGFVDTSAATIATSILIQMVFDEPVTAWGADFFASGVPSGIDFWLIPTDAQDPSDWLAFDGADAFNGFFGFVDDGGALYSGVAIGVGGLAGGQRFGMDDVTGATVPEPSTAVLLALGLAGLAVVDRRR